MSRQQIADRLGASATLSDPRKFARSTQSIHEQLHGAQFLAVVSNNLQVQTDASPEQSPRIAAALALDAGKPREDYLREVSGRETVDRYGTALAFIESLMDDTDLRALHKEVCTLVGTVH